VSLWLVLPEIVVVRHDSRGRLVVLEGADRWMGDPAREAEFLLGQEKWNSREPTVIEDASLLVLVTPKGGRRPETSDIRITAVPKSHRRERLDRVAVTLAGRSGCRYGRLDLRGWCVIRDVPDGRYRLGLFRLTEPSHELLPLPLQRQAASGCWTNADGSVTTRQLSPEWRKILVEADESGADRELSVGRVVNGRLEVQRIHLEHAGDGSRSFATLEFEAAGPPALVCLPLPTS